MALPKRKHSKARRDKSRTHWRLVLPSTRRCPQCARPALPHRACPHCGTYRGRQILVVSQPKSE